MAYTPVLVYSAIFLFMLASAFGLPIPEEIVLLSAGFVGYMTLNPSEYPPPDNFTTGVNVYFLAAFSYAAVVGADFLIYSIGKKLGPTILKWRFFAKLIPDNSRQKIEAWTQKYGYWAVIIFRFTPGVRFPGHIMCGAMKMSAWRFLAVDALAAGLTVPTQVLLMAHYGKQILGTLREFKLIVLGLLGLGLVIFLVRKFIEKRRHASSSII